MSAVSDALGTGVFVQQADQDIGTDDVTRGGEGPRVGVALGWAVRARSRRGESPDFFASIPKVDNWRLAVIFP